jgi:hypothetical protein
LTCAAIKNAENRSAIAFYAERDPRSLAAYERCGAAFPSYGVSTDASWPDIATTMKPVSDTTNPAAVAQDNGSLAPSRQSAIGQFLADALVVALGWGANKME